MKYTTYSKYLKNSGLTEKEVRDKTGISQQYLWGWKKGLYTPNPQKIKPIAELLKIPFEELFK